MNIDTADSTDHLAPIHRSGAREREAYPPRLFSPTFRARVRNARCSLSISVSLFRRQSLQLHAEDASCEWCSIREGLGRWSSFNTRRIPNTRDIQISQWIITCRKLLTYENYEKLYYKNNRKNETKKIYYFLETRFNLNLLQANENRPFLRIFSFATRHV